MTQRSHIHDDSDIAVIGMAGRFPGAANVEAFWQMLVNGVEGVVRYNREDALAIGLEPSLVDREHFVPVGTDIGLVDVADTAAFGLTPNEASHMDPQHRILAEEVWHALDNAGRRHGGGIERVGVFAGCSPSAYLHHSFRHRFDPAGGADPAAAMQIALGTMPDYLATGIAYRMGFTGPAETMLTACSTSLVAVHRAAESLRSGESDLAVAGGVTVRVPAQRGYLHIPDGPFSADGHTRSYGAEATGAVFTQAAGAVVLRRLGDARRDGDPIRAVIRGSAVNNDGAAKAGFIVPGVDGHATVVAEALACAGLEPQDIGMIEGHGTGTLLGDPIEVAALTQVFGKADRPWCRLGSVKSNIGHTEAAAGIAGLIKAVLAVERGVIPASLHCETPNPGLDLDGAALHVTPVTTPWQTEGRCAGVSSLGIGGTNAHVIVAQADREPVRSQDRRSQLWTFGAATESSLETSLNDATAFAATPTTDIPAVARSLADSGGPKNHRGAIVVDGDGAVLDRVDGAPSDAAVLVGACPGGGAQRIGMLEQVYRSEPSVKTRVDRMALAAAPWLGDDLRRICCPDAAGLEPGRTDDPLLGLPALYVATVTTGRLLQEQAGIQPDVWIGHSSGEYAAAVLAGLLDENDVLRMIATRSVALAKLDAGGMVRVRVPETEIPVLLQTYPGMEVAARNSPSSNVLAGPPDVVEQILRDLGDDAVRVRIAVPGHSVKVEPAIPTIRAAAAKLRPTPSTTTLYSCVTGGVAGHEKLADPEHWVGHVRNTVRYRETIAAVLDRYSNVVMLDLGPGAVMAALARENATSSLQRSVSVADDDGAITRSSVLSSVAALYVEGIDVPASALLNDPGPRAALPPYTFTHERAWIEPNDAPVRKTDGPLWVRTRRDRRTPEHVDEMPEGIVTWYPSGDPVTALQHLHAIVEEAITLDATLIIAVDRNDDDGVPTDAVLAAMPSIRAEHPALNVVGAVVHRGDVATAAAQLATAVREDGAEAWSEPVHVDGDRWYDEPLQPAPSLAETSGKIDAALIIGGLGAVGTEVAVALANEGIDVTVTTRRPALEIPELLTNAGVSVAQWDGKDSSALASLIRHVGAGRRVAIVQSSGVVGQAAFSTVEEINADVLEQHRGARIDVWETLNTAIEEAADVTPVVVVAMSSIATAVGGFGLATYAVACRTVERRCEELAKHRRVIAIGWDGWNTAGADQNSFGSHLLRNAWAPQAATALFSSVLHSPLRGTVIATQRQLLKDDESSTSVVARNTVSTAQPNRVLTAPVKGDDDVAPRLREIWADVLGIDPSSVTADADFFALGGQSLDATRLLGMVRDELGIDLRLRDLLDDPTLRGMQRHAPASDTAILDGSTQPNGAVSDGPTATESATPDGPIPLTPVQRAYLLGRMNDYGIGDAACHSFVEFVSDDVDVERLQTAFQQVLARHPMLRSVVDLDGTRLVDVDPSMFQIDVTDLRSTDDAEAKLQHWRERHMIRRAPSTRWPLVCPYVAVTDSAFHIGWSVDVLVCDADSFGLMYGEVGALYRGERLSPAPSMTFAQFASSSEPNPAEEADRQWWAERCDDLPPAPAIISDVDVTGEVPIGGFSRRRWDLGVERSEALRDYAATRRTTPAAVLLTAYSHMLAQWADQTEFSLMLTTFNRPPQMNGVVGEFTELSIVPVQCHTDPVQTLSIVTDGLFDALDHGGVSGVEVLGMRSATDGDRYSLPVVFTSTLGANDAANIDDDWGGRLVAGISQTPQVVLDHQVYHWGEGIVAQWDFLATRIDAERLDTAMQTYRTVVDRILADDPDAVIELPQCAEALVGLGNTEGSATSTLRAGNIGTASPGTAPPVTDLGGDDLDSWAPPARSVSEPGDPLTSLGESSGDDRRRELLDVVRDAWANHLLCAVDDVPDDGQFLTLGGDSLTAVRVVAELRSNGVHVPVADLLSGVSPSQIVDDAVQTGWTQTSVTPATLVRAVEGERFPLTPLQQAYWIGQSGGWDLSYDAAHFVVDYYDELCDPDRLRHAMRRLIAHQPMLRAVVNEDGTQQILEPDDPRLDVDVVEIVDLRDASQDQIDEAIGQTRHTWEQTGPDPMVWPSFRVRAHLLPEGGARVHVAAALVFVDGWSFYIFFDQLLTFHDEPNAILPKPSVTFADYVTTVQAHQNSEEVAHAWAKWRERIPNLPPPPSIPIQTIPSHVDRMERRGFFLHPGHATALADRCRDWGVTPTAVFGAAYAQALREWSRSEQFLLTVLYFNRPTIAADIDQVLGAFSSTVLVDVEPANGDDLLEHITSFRHSVATSLDDAVVDGVDVVREISRTQPHRQLVSPIVFTSTLGFDDPTANSVTSRIDPADVWERVRTPQVLVDVQVASENNRIVCNIDCPEGVIAAADHQALSDRIHNIVQAVVDGAQTLPAFTWPAGSTEIRLNDQVWNGDDDSAVLPEPAAATVQQVQTMMGAHLGRELHPDEDFFEAGGDSLGVIQVLSQLRRETGVSVPPSDAVSSPTPRRIASLVDNAGGTSSAQTGLSTTVSASPETCTLDVETHLIPLDSTAGDPLYLIHPSGGDVLCYADLASSLPNHAVHAIPDPEYLGSAVPDDLGAVIESYTQLIAEAHAGSDRPLVIGGWSMGGTVAHDVAVALNQRGTPVHGVVMIDSTTPDRIRHIAGLEPGEVDAEVALRYLRSLQAFAELEPDRESDLRARLANAESGDARGDVLAERLHDRGMVASDARRRLSVFTRHLAGLAEHQARSLAETETAVLLLRAVQQSPANSGVGMGVDDAMGDPTLGWGTALGPRAYVADIDAHHYTVLRSPAVTAVAEAMNTFLSTIQH